MRHIVAILGFACLLALPARAEWITAAADHAFGQDTPEADACRAAEAKAVEEALRRFNGERIAAEDILRCTERRSEAECTLHRTTWSMVDGDVIGTRNRRASTEPVGVDGFRRCVVRLDVNVAAGAGKPDPGFDLAVRLNNAVLREGEAISLELAPTRPMHVAIFQWLPYEAGDRQVQRIFPNAYDTKAALSGHSTVPSEIGRRSYALRVSFPDGLPAGRKLVDEYLLVVATKNPVGFLERYRLEELKARLLELPRSDVRVVKRGYAVVRAE